jgi:hypothetical protein
MLRETPGLMQCVRVFARTVSFSGREFHFELEKIYVKPRNGKSCRSR